MVDIRFEKVLGLTWYCQVGKEYSLDLLPFVKDWAQESLGYAPSVIVDLVIDPRRCSLRFHSDEDALLFYLRFGSHWYADLVIETTDAFDLDKTLDRLGQEIKTQREKAWDNFFDTITSKGDTVGCQEDDRLIDTMKSTRNYTEEGLKLLFHTCDFPEVRVFVALRIAVMRYPPPRTEAVKGRITPYISLINKILV
jgi:hypothetical protein